MRHKGNKKLLTELDHVHTTSTPCNHPHPHIKQTHSKPHSSTLPAHHPREHVPVLPSQHRTFIMLHRASSIPKRAWLAPEPKPSTTSPSLHACPPGNVNEVLSTCSSVFGQEGRAECGCVVCGVGTNAPVRARLLNACCLSHVDHLLFSCSSRHTYHRG